MHHTKGLGFRNAEILEASYRVAQLLADRLLPGAAGDDDPAAVLRRGATVSRKDAGHL